MNDASFLLLLSYTIVVAMIITPLGGSVVHLIYDVAARL